MWMYINYLYSGVGKITEGSDKRKWDLVEHQVVVRKLKVEWMEWNEIFQRRIGLDGMQRY